MKVTAVDGGPRLYFVHLLGGWLSSELAKIIGKLSSIVKCTTMKKLKKREKFMNLLKRRGLTQTQFAEKVRLAWQEISGRSLSRQAVNAWINGRDVPHFSPAEVLVVLEILNCTLIELAIAFPHEKSNDAEKNLDKSLDNVKQTSDN